MTPAKRNILAWAYGLAAAFVQGGAAALAATVTASLIDPEKFNLGQQLRNFLEMAGVTFVVSGVLGAAGYLKQSPLPPITGGDGLKDRTDLIDRGDVRLGGGTAWARSEPDWQIKRASIS